MHMHIGLLERWPLFGWKSLLRSPFKSQGTLIHAFSKKALVELLGHSPSTKKLELFYKRQKFESWAERILDFISIPKECRVSSCHHHHHDPRWQTTFWLLYFYKLFVSKVTSSTTFLVVKMLSSKSAISLHSVWKSPKNGLIWIFTQIFLISTIECEVATSAIFGAKIQISFIWTCM